MAFQETTTAETGDGKGLPVHFDRLKKKQCPRCGADLEEFAHACRWACYDCGFKISTAAMEARVSVNTGRGYFIGLTNFHDETPF